jgi:hypothetical protein
MEQLLMVAMEVMVLLALSQVLLSHEVAEVVAPSSVVVRLRVTVELVVVVMVL